MTPLLTDAFAWVDTAPKADGTVRTLACNSLAVKRELAAQNEPIYVSLCDEAMAGGEKYLYLPTLDLPDKTLDALIDYTLENKAHLAVRCCSTLTEAGRIDSRFGKSAVMLLHEFGLLEHSTVISGVYLDKDDLSLMAQEEVPLVVLPSEDAGYGNGIAPVYSAIERSVQVKLGSGDGVYNPSRSVLKEAALLRLLVAAQMNKRDALPLEVLSRMCAADATAREMAEIEKMISA